MVLSSPPLFVSTMLPPGVKPATLPPMVYAAGMHVTSISVTSEFAVPEPFATVHISLGFIGCAPAVVLYVEPCSYRFGNENAPDDETCLSSIPLLSSTRPLPVSPVTLPPITTKPGGTPPSPSSKQRGSSWCVPQYSGSRCSHADRAPAKEITRTSELFIRMPSPTRWWFPW